jgi:hypothetical protein
MFVIRVRNTVGNIMILCIFLGLTSLATTKLLTLLPGEMQPGVFIMLFFVYWLMLDNITFATDLVAAETRSLLHQEAEKAATKIAVAAVAAAAAADNAYAKHRRDDQHFRKRASSFIVN